MELTDKVVIVTGASSGIGQATARRLAGEGARHLIASGEEQAVLVPERLRLSPS